MLIHNNATDHSNGKLWNLNAEKIEKKKNSISRSDKVNHLLLESKKENNPIPAFYIKRAAPKSLETWNLCSFPVSEYLLHFLVGVVVKNHVTDDVSVVSISGRGSAISSAQEGKAGFMTNKLFEPRKRARFS